VLKIWEIDSGKLLEKLCIPYFASLVEERRKDRNNRDAFFYYVFFIYRM